jgi:hypothetical protein
VKPHVHIGVTTFVVGAATTVITLYFWKRAVVNLDPDSRLAKAMMAIYV